MLLPTAKKLPDRTSQQYKAKNRPQQPKTSNLGFRLFLLKHEAE
jgi:hypothetical protein